MRAREPHLSAAHNPYDANLLKSLLFEGRPPSNPLTACVGRGFLPAAGVSLSAGGLFLSASNNLLHLPAISRRLGLQGSNSVGCDSLTRDRLDNHIFAALGVLRQG